MLDVALHHRQRVTPDTALMAQLGLNSRSSVLATIHRAENTDHPERLSHIVDALSMVGQNIPVVWPIHPRTKAVLTQSCRLATLSGQVKLIDPVGYLDMVQLKKFAALVVTDSGGVQKEAFFHGVPCVTLRNETEWTELIESGWNTLIPPTSPQMVVASILASVNKQGHPVQPYGTGQAAELMVRQLQQDLSA
jgi:UDP-GlcNAc3NAcA epimerase